MTNLLINIPDSLYRSVKRYVGTQEIVTTLEAAVANGIVISDLCSSAFPNKSEIPTGSTTKDDLGVDAISRAQTQTEIEMNASRYTIAKERCGMGQVEWSDELIKVSDAIDIIRNLPPVTPQEPKTGHWIGIDKTHSQCDRCESIFEISSTNGEIRYCPNCGIKMVEPQESEAE